ncbi:MAG: cyclic nucleotide-binding domain-containing protein [Akkermansiaceae bacterium]|nr:cyclic nucleotide-binding domain-containing protein [Akkermansiaceae bacterium]NNM29278.1 cyclic nucleotide-binding domain-containing protein [Akkermansiaceae bacterium]
MEQAFFRNALFEGIPPEDLDSLHIGIEQVRYEPGDIIFEDGDEGHNLCLVAEGAVRISKKGRGGDQETLAVKKAGEFFGEMALLDGQPRSARATAEGPVLLGKIDAASLNRFFAQVPDATLHVMRAMTQQLRSTSSLYVHELLKAERLSLMGSMMSSIVHDLKNPIATIMMAGDSLTSRKDDERLVRTGELLRRATDRMHAMIQELLEFSRGTIRIEVEVIPVREVIDAMQDSVLKRLANNGVEVKIEIEHEGGIPLDKHRMIRLLSNIVGNAGEAMPEGGTLTIRVRKVDDKVELEIEDTGCGIPAEILPRVFEPFVTHGKAGGTGLGMAIAKAVVEAHGGTIWMESEEGRGTTCHIALPAGA